TSTHHAGATPSTGLGDGDPRSVLGGDARRPDASGAAADHEEVDIETRHGPRNIRPSTRSGIRAVSGYPELLFNNGLDRPERVDTLRQTFRGSLMRASLLSISLATFSLVACGSSMSPSHPGDDVDAP